MPLNIDWQQILLHALNFVILVGGLYFLLFNPVKKFMAKREEYCRGMEEKAEQTLREAEQLKADYASQLETADAEIDRRRAEAQRALDASVEQQLSDAKAQAAEIVQDAYKAADRTRAKILADTQKELTELAVEAAKKLVYQNEGDVFESFLDQAEGGESNE